MAEKLTGVKIYDKVGDHHIIPSAEEIKNALTHKQYVLDAGDNSAVSGIKLGNVENKTVPIQVDWSYVDSLLRDVDSNSEELKNAILNNRREIEALQGAIIYIGVIPENCKAIEAAQVITAADKAVRKAALIAKYKTDAWTTHEQLNLNNNEYAKEYALIDSLTAGDDETPAGTNSLLDNRITTIRGKSDKLRGYCLIDKQNNAWVWSCEYNALDELLDDDDAASPPATSPSTETGYSRWVNIGYTEIAIATNDDGGDAGSLGLVKGVLHSAASSDAFSGYVHVNENGTMRVNGWEELIGMGITGFEYRSIAEENADGDAPGIYLNIILKGENSNEDLTLPIASDSTNGVMSSTQQKKLKALEIKDIDIDDDYDEDTFAKTVKITKAAEDGATKKTLVIDVPKTCKVTHKVKVAGSDGAKTTVQGGLSVHIRDGGEDEENVYYYHINTRTEDYPVTNLLG